MDPLEHLLPPIPSTQPLPLRSRLLAAAGFRHAFFTRCGGVSVKPFDTLNFGTHVGDNPRNVQQNFVIAAQDLGVAPERILYLSQVHGTGIHVVAPPFHHDETFRIEGDAIIAHDPTVACSVRIADCAPVLIADRHTGRVAAIHSGWRGTEQHIVQHVVQALQSMGSQSIDLLASVGPLIEVCCFETGWDVAERLARSSSAKNAVRNAECSHPHVDLRRILHAQLIEAGVHHEHVDHVGGCTMCDADRFFSYRREGQRTGRLLAAIVPRAGTA